MTREKLYKSIAEEYNELLISKKEKIEETIKKLRDTPCGTVGNAEKHLEAIKEAEEDLRVIEGLVTQPDGWRFFRTKCNRCNGTGLRIDDRYITYY